MQKISHSYFVVMEDHGKLGLEAIVQPEITGREVVDRIKNGDYKNIVFIHHVDGLQVEDITDDLIRQAHAELHGPTDDDLIADRLAARWDSQRDLRKEMV